MHFAKGGENMGLCRMSDESIIKSSVLLDNKFVTDYMAEADEIQLKVYIFGLYQCLNPVIADNTAAHFCNSLAITEEQLLSAFEYWKTTGLVNIVSYDPLEVRYNRVRSVDVSGKLYKPSKYTEFNTQLQDIFPDREVSQGEFLKYYEFLEETRLPQEVLLMIASYCVNYKGYGVRQQYVLAGPHRRGCGTVYRKTRGCHRSYAPYRKSSRQKIRYRDRGQTALHKMDAELGI